MGRRSRSERRAKRKIKRANKKIEKAIRKENKGKTKRANKLRKRAEVLKRKAGIINTQITGQVIRGLTANVVSANSLGNVIIRASWNYQANELEKYDELYLTLAPSSPFRGSINRQEGTTSKSSSSFDFQLTRNFRYVVKLFGSVNGRKRVIDRTYVKKNY